MENLPEGLTENDLTFQKLLVTAFLDRWKTGSVDEAIWDAVHEALSEVVVSPVGSAAALLDFAELVAGLLSANYEDPLETLSSLKSYSGHVDD